MKKFIPSFIAVILVGFLFNVGCSRPQQKSVGVTIDLPSSGVGSLAGGHTHVSFNVSGVGVDILCVLELDTTSTIQAITSGPCLFDTTLAGKSFSLDLPTGVNLTFQVVYSYKDSTGADVFGYAEQTKALSLASESVNFVISSFSSLGGQGNFFGQYADGTTANPSFRTGVLNMIYHPPTGSKPMLVYKTEMYRGWFKLHSLEADFSYEINGSPLFTDLNPSGIMRYSGLMSSVTAGSSLYSTISNVSTSGTNSNTIGWFGPGKVVTNFSSTSSGSLGGCSGTAEYMSCLVNGTVGGIMQASDFRGPFKAPASTGGVFTVATVGSTSTTINATLLPGVTIGTTAADTLNGLTVVKISGITSPSALNSYMVSGDGAWNCAALVSIGTILTGWTATSGVVSVPVASLASTDVVFLCPQVNGILMTGAVAYPDSYNHNGGGSSGPYLHLNIGGTGVTYTPGNPDSYSYSLSAGTIGTGTAACMPITVGLYQGQGTPLSSSTTLSIVLTYSNTTILQFYGTNTCTTTPMPSMTATISAGSSASLPVYAKTVVNGTTAGTMAMSITPTGSTIITNPQIFNIVP